MRITGSTARAITEYLHEISNGQVGIAQIGGDIGNGARIIDGNQQIVWLAEPRKAVAYYLGQVDAYAEARSIARADLPAIVREAHTEIMRDGRPKITTWYTQGKGIGAFRANQK